MPGRVGIYAAQWTPTINLPAVVLDASLSFAVYGVIQTRKADTTEATRPLSLPVVTAER